MSLREISHREKQAWVIGRTVFVMLMMWTIQYPWGEGFVIGMLLLDVAQLNYRAFVNRL